MSRQRKGRAAFPNDCRQALPGAGAQRTWMHARHRGCARGVACVRQRGSGRLSGEWRLARRRQAQHCSSPLQRSTEQRPLSCQWQGRQAGNPGGCPLAHCLQFGKDEVQQPQVISPSRLPRRTSVAGMPQTAEDLSI
jgi:hypothetical protein